MNNLLRGIIAASLKNRLAVIFLTVILVVVGVVSYLNTPIEAFPDVTNARVIIITQWPGRSAEEVEKFITIPIEVELNSVPKRNSLRSISLFGLSVISVIFEDDVQEFEARQNVANRLASAQIPDDAEPEIQPPYGPTGEVYRYTLRSDSRTVRQLKTIQDWVIDRQIKSVPGIADVVSFGGEVKTFEIGADPRLLSRYGISALQVYEAVARSNVNVGGDVIVKNDQAYVVRGVGLLNNINEIENIIIDNYAGVPVLVKNVATVTETCLPRLGYVGRSNERDVVEGIVVMRKGENPSQVLKDLKLKIEDLNEHILPKGVRIETFYDRTDLIGFTTNTVTHNLLEGVLLVTFVVFIFMLDWRTTVIVSVIIPLALLFAFMCLRLRGMSANLLSMGAIDFGIIIDGAVVMVEGLFVVLDQMAKRKGMVAFDKVAKLSLILRTSTSLGRAVFFSKLIIIAALLPIFAFQKVEGKMFSPLAFTLGFALLGALIFTLTLVPVMVSYLLNRNVKERHNYLLEYINYGVLHVFDFLRKYPKRTILGGVVLLVLALGIGTRLGTEFLPELNEGSVYVRASLPLSTSLEQSIRISDRIRKGFQKFPEVKQVLSQAGRPNDGTDPTGFFNIEFHVDLYPKEEWKRGLKKEEVIQEMKDKLEEQYQGINFNFSQPIMDNVEEAVSGVKGSMAVKLFGSSPEEMEQLAGIVQQELSKVQGVEDLGIINSVGQPELRIELNQEKMGLYGVTTQACQGVIEMAIGGKSASRLYEGERRFDIRLRYLPQFRSTEQSIGDLLVPTAHGVPIPLKSIADIKFVSGLAFLYRENNERFVAVKFSVRGRDLGGTIAEAQQRVKARIGERRGLRIDWKGQFENQVRATNRLGQVLPVSLGVIFLILFILFGNFKDSLLVLTNVPFAIIGGIVALWLTGVNFSISAGIGFIALLGICVQNGVILISVFREKLTKREPLETVIREGVQERIRPIVMTALMASLGLLPAALSTGIGSESQKPLAIVIIGGLISATLLTLFVFPLIVEQVYKRTEFHSREE